MIFKMKFHLGMTKTVGFSMSNGKLFLGAVL